MTARLLLLVAGLVASLALAETVLLCIPVLEPNPRTWVGDFPDRPSEHLVPDPEIGWRMRPNRDRVVSGAEYHVRYRSNDQGFRDERAGDSRAKRRAIALVGDSFTFGVGVSFDQTYGALLESRLPETAVHNFALAAYGLDQMWRVVSTVAIPIRPDLVIVAFISDDFTRSLTVFRNDVGFNKPTFVLRGGALVRQTRYDGPSGWFRFLERHSRLWAGAKEAVRLLGHHFGVGPWWDLNQAILDAIRAECREAGTQVLFVYLPTAKLRTFPALPVYMERTGADFLDLGNQPLGAPGMLHYPADGHPNPEGHRRVSDALLAWIAREMPELASRAAQ